MIASESSARFPAWLPDLQMPGRRKRARNNDKRGDNMIFCAKQHVECNNTLTLHHTSSPAAIIIPTATICLKWHILPLIDIIVNIKIFFKSCPAQHSSGGQWVSMVLPSKEVRTTKPRIIFLCCGIVYYYITYTQYYNINNTITSTVINSVTIKAILYQVKLKNTLRSVVIVYV